MCLANINNHAEKKPQEANIQAAMRYIRIQEVTRVTDVGIYCQIVEN